MTRIKIKRRQEPAPKVLQIKRRNKKAGKKCWKVCSMCEVFWQSAESAEGTRFCTVTEKDVDNKRKHNCAHFAGDWVVCAKPTRKIVAPQELQIKRRRKEDSPYAKGQKIKRIFV